VQQPFLSVLCQDGVALGFVLIFDLNRHIPWRFHLNFTGNGNPDSGFFFSMFAQAAVLCFSIGTAMFFCYNCFLTSYHSKQDFYIVVLMLFYITEDLLYCSLFTGIIWEFVAVNLFFCFFFPV